jgi:hypothetical protein
MLKHLSLLDEKKLDYFDHVKEAPQERRLTCDSNHLNPVRLPVHTLPRKFFEPRYIGVELITPQNKEQRHGQIIKQHNRHYFGATSRLKGVYE